jgi:RNA polymerase sigma factor (sigma-70 family)
MPSGGQRPRKGKGPSSQISATLLARLYDEDNDAAIRTLVNESDPLVREFVQRQRGQLGLPRHGVEAVVQNVLLGAHRALRRRLYPRGPAIPETWYAFLYELVRRHGTNQRVREARGHPHQDTSPEAAERLEDATNEDRPVVRMRGAWALSDNPDAVVARAEDWERMCAAAEHLAGEERRTWDLLFADIHVAEAAAICGVRPGTISHRRTKVLLKLQTMLNAEDESG